MKTRMKTYSGQAIAIIMVVLVVATVIGASLYSRMVRNRGEIVQTRESQRALEQADTILDTFISSDLMVLQSAINELLGANTSYTFEDLADLKLFDGIDPTILTQAGLAADWCDEGVDTDSNLEVTVGYATASSAIEYDVGEVMAINLGAVTFPVGSTCSANLTLTTGGAGDHLFTIKKVYMDKVSGNVTPYQLAHMKLYCLNSSGVNCSNAVVAPISSIEDTFASGDTINIPLATDPNLYEVRVIPLKEKLGVAVVPVNCGNILNNYSIRAKVNCKGDVREKEVIIPNQNNMGYPAIFDYTIYNANGILSPS